MFLGRGSSALIQSGGGLAAPMSPDYFPTNVGGRGCFVQLADQPMIAPAVDGSDNIVNVEVGGELWAEINITLCDIIEDQKRNRLIGLAHISKRIDNEAGSGHHAIFMYTAPWGYPQGPWTRCNPVGDPMLAAGELGDFDYGLAAQPSGVIEGDTLYMSYVGMSIPHWDLLGEGALLKHGLAQVTLTDNEVAVPLHATKLRGDEPAGNLVVGGSPGHGMCPTLRKVGDTWHYWVGQCADGPVELNPLIPRLYTAANFSAATADWTPHPQFKHYGHVVPGSNPPSFASGMIYVGGNRWITPMCGAIDLDGNGGFDRRYDDFYHTVTSITLGETSSVVQGHGDFFIRVHSLAAEQLEFTGGGNLDGQRMLYHNGDWWLWYMLMTDNAPFKYRAATMAKWSRDTAYTKQHDEYGPTTYELMS